MRVHRLTAGHCHCIQVIQAGGLRDSCILGYVIRWADNYEAYERLRDGNLRLLGEFDKEIEDVDSIPLTN